MDTSRHTPKPHSLLHFTCHPFSVTRGHQQTHSQASLSAALYVSSFFCDTWTLAVTHSQASLSAALYTSSFFCDTWTPADTHSQASLSAALYTSSFFCDTWTPADTHSQASLSAGFLPPNPDIIAHPVPVADVFVDSNPTCDVSDFTSCVCC